MSSKKQECSICLSGDLIELFRLNHYPAYVLPVPVTLARSVKRVHLMLHVCRGCGHIQIVNPDAELQRLIYDEYYSHYSLDACESFVPHYRKPFTDFCDGLLQKSLVTKGDLLEIGCSSGRQVNYLRKFARTYYGIDPSDRIEVAVKNFPDDHFFRGYFPEGVSGKHFDVIVAQFILEHVENVRELVSKIHSLLKKEGVVVIQVPDVEDFVRNGQPLFVAHEHIQYFTKKSLQDLLLSRGFEVIAWVAEGPSLIVAAKKACHAKSNYDFAEGLERALNDAKGHKQMMCGLPTCIPKKVIYYGVGPQLFWLLSDKNDGIDECIVFDDNPNYEGKGLPGYKNVIQKPMRSVIEEYGHVVLSLNSIYHPAVMKKLKSFRVPVGVYHLNPMEGWKIVEIHHK